MVPVICFPANTCAHTHMHTHMRTHTHAREDWPTQHLFQTLYMLCEQKQSTFAFLKNGGMAFASRMKSLTAESLAAAARIAPRGGIKDLMQNTAVPQTVRDALSAMQLSQADVIGTDGHRRLCRREGWAYMETFGAPLVFTTPNLADTKQVLLLRVQGYKVELDASDDLTEDSPKYRDMMCRLARDPVGQTVVFELLMRLFFLHVLGVRPECLHNRRKSVRKHTREWCTDGVAAASTFFGMFGPVLAFRGEVEAQGRGSLHPHNLVWRRSCEGGSKGLTCAAGCRNGLSCAASGLIMLV